MFIRRWTLINADTASIGGFPRWIHYPHLSALIRSYLRLSFGGAWLEGCNPQNRQSFLHDIHLGY